MGTKGATAVAGLLWDETRHWCFVLWLKLKHSCGALVGWWEQEEQEAHTGLSVR